MIIVPFRADHMLEIQAQGAQQYLGPYMTPAHARSLEQTLAFSAVVDGQVLAVGGVYEMWAGRGLAWSYLDGRIGKHFVALHRVVQNYMDTAPFRRIEAEVDCEFEAGHRWLRKLGFTMEAPRMRAFRVDGGDSALYAKVK